MRILLYIISLSLFIPLDRSFNSSKSIEALPIHKVSVVILPPYDVIAGRGGSPNVWKIITATLKADSSFDVLSLNGMNCSMIYDKKYCGEIIKELHPDIILMMKLDCLSPDKKTVSEGIWKIEIKAYSPKKDSTIILYRNPGIQNDGRIEKEISSKFDSGKLKDFTK